MKTLKVAVSSIHAFRADNVSRSGSIFKDEKDKQTLIGLLVLGIDPIVLPYFTVYELNAEQQEAAVKERDDMQALLAKEPEFPISYGKQEMKISVVEQKQQWELLNMDKGKIAKPKYGLVLAFRRFSILPIVNAIRTRLGQNPITEYDVNVKTYASTFERYSDTIRENGLKKAGSRDITNDWKSLVVAGKALFTSSGQTVSEAEMQHMLGIQRGTAQKLYKVVQLDGIHKSLNIVDRIESGDLNPGPWSTSKGDERHLIALAKDANATDEEVEGYLKGTVAKGGNAPKMAEKKKIKDTSTNYKANKMVSFILMCVHDNKLEELSNLFPAQAAKECSELFDKYYPSK